LSAGTRVNYVIFKVLLKGGDWDQRCKFQGIFSYVPVMYWCKAEGITSKSSRSRGGD